MSDAEQSGAGRREVAYRLFAAEYDAADLSYSEGEEDRAPNYVVTPTGARVNRTFVVGVLTEVETVSEDVLRARVVDPTGAFVLYAGQYQPDEQAFLDTAETPTFVAVTGKARTFQPEDSTQVYTSIRPESINEVDAGTRDRWSVGTAERTLQRVERMATALGLDQRGQDLRETLASEGVDEGLAAGIALALDHYDTSPAYLQAVREMALDAARVVAGELDEVDPVSLSPDAPGDADLEALAGETGRTVTARSGGERDATEPTGDDGDTSEAASSDTTESTSAPTGETAAVTASEESTAAASGEATAAGDVSGTGTGASAETDSQEATPEDVGDFEPGEFELDEEEREEIQEEFGTEFQSGTEVDEPGEADIETPDPDETTPEQSATDEPAAVQSTTDQATTEATTSDQSAGESSEGASGEDVTSADDAGGSETQASDDDHGAAEPADVDLEDATVDVMGELDDGSGADRETLIETVGERYGADRADVEDAIQDALMDGRCYEPDDDTLKPI